MRVPFKYPQYKRVYYQFNPETGYFKKIAHPESLIPFQRLPNEVKIVATQADKIKRNAKELLVSRERSRAGSFKFITGIQPTSLTGWFVGNDFERKGERKILSLILFWFKNGNNNLEAYYFPGYYKSNPESRLSLAEELISHLSENG